MSVIAYDDFNRNGEPGGIGGSWSDVFDEQGQFGDVQGHLSLGWDPSASTVAEMQAATVPAVSSFDGHEIVVPARAFSCMRVIGDVATCQPTRRDLMHNPSDYTFQGRYLRPTTNITLQVGHFLAYQDLGVDDEIEVGVRWRTPNVFSALGQVSPAAFIDTRADPHTMGLVPIYDCSLDGAVYIQNAFRNPENDVFDGHDYRMLGYDGQMHSDGSAFQGWDEQVQGPNPCLSTIGLFSYGPGESRTMALRASQGQIAMYVDGTRVIPPVGSKIDNQEIKALDVPVEFQGRTCWGIHVIAAQPDPKLALTVTEATSGVVESSEVLDYDTPIQIDYWYATDFDATTSDWDDDLYTIP